MIELPSRTARRAHLEAVLQWIERFYREHDDELSWICVPHLLVQLRLRPLGRYPVRLVASNRVEARWRKVRAGTPDGWTFAGGHLFLASTDNQGRAQEPIARRLGIEEPGPEGISVSRTRIEELRGRAVALAEELIGTARRIAVELPMRRLFLYWQFLRAARDLAWWEALLEAVRPRTVVVGSTHSAPARALALAARHAGIPSVYVPHAPLISDARLADLPVDFAGVRGPHELSHYAALGADPDGLEAIGNPAVESITQVPEFKGDRAAFATSADDYWALEQFVRVVQNALGERVIASPHPRTDRKLLQTILPAQWDLWRGRTFDLLMQGPPAVVQCSSGVALEALQLGIPTIELAFPGEAPNYRFAREPYVTTVRNSAELRAAVGAAAGVSPSKREELRAWAHGWVSKAGADAAVAGAALLEKAGEEGIRKTPLWDAWAPHPAGRFRRLLRRAS